MGFSITWCAVPQRHAERFLQALQLVPTGETEEDVPGSLITTASLDSGWQLLFYNEYSCPFLQESDRKRTSADFDILFCLVEEHVMASSSEMWSCGKRKWWLSHVGENGPKGLDVDGDLPDTYPGIRKELETAQLEAGGDDADVDFIFEIPLSVAQSLVGFKHDEICQRIVNNRYVVLRRIS